MDVRGSTTASIEEFITMTNMPNLSGEIAEAIISQIVDILVPLGLDTAELGHAMFARGFDLIRTACGPDHLRTCILTALALADPAPEPQA